MSNKVFASIFLFMLFASISYYPQSWEKICSEDMKSTIYDMQFDSAGNFYVGFGSRLFCSPDRGKTWKELYSQSSNPSNYITNILLLNKQEIFISSYYLIDYSSDAGKTWSRLSAGSDFIVSDNENTLYAGFEVRRSFDKGVTWEVLVNKMYCWSFYHKSDGKLLAGTNCGIYLSEDKGVSWIRTGFFDCGDIMCIKGVNNDSLIFVVGADRFKGIQYSSDGGYNWIKVPNSDSVLWGTSILPLNNNEIYFGSMFNGLFLYNISNSSLIRINSEEFKSVGALALDSLGFLYVSTSEIYRSKYTLDSVKYNRNKNGFLNKSYLDSYILYQNYPNPFNPITTISYNIPKDEFVSLKVYDLLGNEVVRLLNKQQSAGEYSITFDGSNFTSGMYIYQLISGEFVATKKLMLLK